VSDNEEVESTEVQDQQVSIGKLVRMGIDSCLCLALSSDNRHQEEQVLQRFAQVIQLLPEAEAEYIRLHEQVWPEVLQTIASCGIANYSIFLRNGMLFAYFEYHGADYEGDMRKMAADHNTQQWWHITDPMQLPSSGALPGEKWSTLREVFHCDGALQLVP
jgi:L-rhamnose mutarotase